MAKKQFKAESKRLLDLMINSIYTHKEIFLREIVSNASDAIDKLCYVSLTDDKVGLNRSDFRIRLYVDKERGTLTVSDNGIGMSKEELESNLGVIARSGSLNFKKELEEGSGSTGIDIIGQFGVGFYSAFMVADSVTVTTRAYGESSGNRWESSGADGYTVTEEEKESVGTDVCIHLKPDTEDENYSGYLESANLRRLVKKYSDYIRWPIIMDIEKHEMRETGEKDEKGSPKKEYVTVTEEQTVNSMVPIWQRGKTEASDADCAAFYKERFHDIAEPVSVIRINAEGAVSYKAMLFVPEKAPYDYFTREYEAGLQLYSSGVMIMEKCPDLLPECFRFVRGVVDSPDLSLNISREMLQHDRQLKAIAANLEKKIKSELSRLMESEPEKYESFYKSFGIQLKYGIVSDFGSKKDLLKDLVMFNSSAQDRLVPLRDYVKNMQESQKLIYYVCSDSVRRAAKLPQTEQVADKGYEILYLTEDVDEFVIQSLGSYGEKSFCNISTDELGFETEEEKKEIKDKEELSKKLLDFVKESLGASVSAVKLSGKLKSHPVYLSTEGQITLEMEKYFRSVQGEGEALKAERVLELNGGHPAFLALESAYKTDRDKAAKLSKILLAQATLIAGLPLEDPSEYSELVCTLF